MPWQVFGPSEHTHEPPAGGATAAFFVLRGSGEKPCVAAKGLCRATVPSVRGAMPSSLRAFTLIELLLTMALLALIVVLLSSTLDHSQKVMAQNEARLSAFQEARTVFQRISHNLAQATLNPLWDYVDAAGNRRTANNSNFVPNAYQRVSDLHFVTGPASALLGGATRPTHAVFFQAPVGFSVADPMPLLDKALAGVGYFIEFGTEEDSNSMLPTFLNLGGRHRFRLKEFLEPQEKLQVYNNTGHAWYKSGVTDEDEDEDDPRPVRTIAENIIALIVLPARSDDDAALAPKYLYDTRNSGATDIEKMARAQLPPLVRVVLVAIGERSAMRLQEQYGSAMPQLIAPDLFQDAAELEDDLGELEKDLQEQNITYRIFSRTIPIAAAKWSE